MRLLWRQIKLSVCECLDIHTCKSLDETFTWWCPISVTSTIAFLLVCTMWQFQDHVVDNVLSWCHHHSDNIYQKGQAVGLWAFWIYVWKPRQNTYSAMSDLYCLPSHMYYTTISRLCCEIMYHRSVIAVLTTFIKSARLKELHTATIFKH